MAVSGKTGGNFVESPQHGATDGILIELERQANAAVVEAKTEQSVQSDQQAQAAGQEVEEKRHSAGAEASNRVQASAEATVVTEAATTVAGASAQMLSAGAEILSERSSNPSKNTADIDNASSKMGGMMGVNAKRTSFEDQTNAIKKNPQGNMSAIESPMRGKSFLEKVGISTKSLGGQGDTTVGKQVNEQITGSLAASKQYVMSLGIANEKVLAQVQAMRQQNSHNLNHAPGMGSNAPQHNHTGVSAPKGPNFDKAKADTQDDWMGS